ncbi:lysine transporter LysE [Rubrolithibacter danxiaensis]|uniref:lysine transporter LysE n=1 Tax=Rubrolithibacter danxiaensis TaxID=3390805 RepID=UPI003BF81981
MLFLTFFVAIVINFFGYIPLGNINLTTVQIAVNRGVKQALYFITTFSIVEGFCTYVLMRFAEWFASNEKWLYLLDWILIVVFLILGFLSLRASTHPKQVQFRKRDSVRYGIILGIFNPMQIPFWMIGGTYLISHHWITTAGWGLQIFSIGAAIGAFICLYLFVRFARYIQDKFALSNRIINRSIAFVFFLLAALHIIKLIWVFFK